MRILAIESELRQPPGDVARQILQDEARRVWALKKRDIIRDIWFTGRGKNAVVMLECESEKEAAQILSSLPLVREGYIEFEIHALRPYDGFDRLFDVEESGEKRGE